MCLVIRARKCVRGLWRYRILSEDVEMRMEMKWRGKRKLCESNKRKLNSDSDSDRNQDRFDSVVDEL